MKEVSCRILDMFFRELEKKGIPEQRLIANVGYSASHMRNKHERIEWSAFVRLMANAQEIWSEDEIVAMGGAWIDSPVLRHTRAIAGALFTPKQFYQWLAKDSSKSATNSNKTTGGGAEMISCVHTTFFDRGPDRLSLECRLDEGYEPCPAFFLLNRGGFRDIPRLAGKPCAAIEVTPIENGVRYDITLAPGSDKVNRMHRAVRWITSPRVVAKELEDSHASLQARYEELEIARAKLAVQAAQLRVAHDINELIQRDLDLDLTLRAIAESLVLKGGFARASVTLDTEVDGVKIARSASHGEGGSIAIDRPLDGRGGNRAGVLTVWAHASANVTEREELLSFVVPSIAMALDDAISYLVVEEYRRGLERRVEERTFELSQARDALAKTVLDLERAKEARDRIFANINHDLRSPLSLILLAVSEARRAGALTEDGERTLSAIEHGARRVLRMVDELLILAEGREGTVRLSTANIDLAELASNVAEAWKPAARAAGLTLDNDVAGHELGAGTRTGAPPAPIFVRADPNALERILANLVSNAIKFTPKNGKVTLHLSIASGRARIEVRDTGAGIDDELKTRLFGRFERGARAKSTAISGSGLGLSLVKELAEAHGGTATVHDNPGGGSIFRVELPLADRNSIAPSAFQEQARSNDDGIVVPVAALRPQDYGVAIEEPQQAKTYDPPPGVTARATILLAEDDPELRERTARLLAEEYRVLAAPDGLIAIDLATKHSPDLLVTDIQMPGIDGIELTRRFRALPNTRLAPVLLVTTFGGVGDKLSGFDAGAVDYIHKPFEPAELRARLKSQLMVRSLALQLLETEKLAALGTLSAGLAHEIRNPANGIINAVAPLRELLPPEVLEPNTPTAQLLDIVEHCSKQVAAMSRQLLGFKRNVEPKRQAVPLGTLIQRVCTTARPALEGVELREALDYKGPIHCAEPLIAQVLTNLVQNGAHAAGRGGWVEVRTKLDADRVVVEVRDSGPGVPDDLRERIFEPFFTTKPAGSGTGLGLSTARDIVLRHGGSLDVRNASGKTVFRVEIPVPS